MKGSERRKENPPKRRTAAAPRMRGVLRPARPAGVTGHDSPRPRSRPRPRQPTVDPEKPAQPPASSRRREEGGKRRRERETRAAHNREQHGTGRTAAPRRRARRRHRRPRPGQGDLCSQQQGHAEKKQRPGRPAGRPSAAGFLGTEKRTDDEDDAGEKALGGEGGGGQGASRHGHRPSKKEKQGDEGT